MPAPNYSKIICPQGQTTTHPLQHYQFKTHTFFLNISLYGIWSCYCISVERIHWDVIAYKWLEVFCNGKEKEYLCTILSVRLVHRKENTPQCSSKYTLTDLYFLLLFSKHIYFYCHKCSSLPLMQWILFSSIRKSTWFLTHFSLEILQTGNNTSAHTASLYETTYSSPNSLRFWRKLYFEIIGINWYSQDFFYFHIFLGLLQSFVSGTK